MKLRFVIAAVAIFSLISCGSKKEKDDKKQNEKEVVLSPEQAAEKYCQCQNELLELSKQSNPDMKAKMKECKDLQTAFDKQYMKNPESQKAFLDAYFACMPKDSSMTADSVDASTK